MLFRQGLEKGRKKKSDLKRKNNELKEKQDYLMNM